MVFFTRSWLGLRLAKDSQEHHLKEDLAVLSVCSSSSFICKLRRQTERAARGAGDISGI